MSKLFRRGAPARGAHVDAHGTLEPVVLHNDGVTAMGAASSVTQTGNNSADVTLNRGHGKIVMAAALNAGVGAHFRLLNSLITSDSIVVLHVETGTATGNGARNTVTTNLSSISAGSCNIQIFNDDGNNTWAPPIVHFLVLN